MVIENFNKFAYFYQNYNIIQKKLIKKYLPFTKKRVIDLGCGSEGLCKYKKFDFYLGIEISENMLKLNPCKTIKLDFNTKECFEVIKRYDFSQIVSFSALQWAKDLNFIFKEIEKLNKDYLITIFTSNTFKSLHNFLEITSPIYSHKEIIAKSKILNPKIEILHYELKFNDPLSMLNYIKFSGVKGEVRANVGRVKKFIKTFPIKKLEFEIVVLRN